MQIYIKNLEGRSEAEDIGRCLFNLYSTPEGTIAGDRDFGLSWAALDNVPAEAESIYALEVMEKTDKYESRVKVMEVIFTSGVATIVLQKAGGEDIGG
jgi:phage baseplate assembly protein W